MAGTLFIISFPCESYEESKQSKATDTESKNGRDTEAITNTHPISSSDDELNYYYQNQRVI